MRRHGLSAIALIVMIALAAGSVDTEEGSERSMLPTDSTYSTNDFAGRGSNPYRGTKTKYSSTYTSVSHDNPEVQRIYDTRMEQYTSQHKAWTEANDVREEVASELAKMTKEVARLSEDKPTPLKFDVKEWATVLGGYKTKAVMVDTDNKTVTLRKSSGATVTVPKDKLVAENRMYIEDAFVELTDYKGRLAVWTRESSHLDARHKAAEQELAIANSPEPERPSLSSIAAEVAAENERERQELLAKQREADRKAAAAAAEAAAALAEVELNVGGLVLMRKTISGRKTDFGGVITGIVENRRRRKLSYVQISFNLYDDSGAQVGSAMANVNGLESGGKWKFEANSFGKDFSTYKFSELTGF